MWGCQEESVKLLNLSIINLVILGIATVAAFIIILYRKMPMILLNQKYWMIIKVAFTLVCLQQIGIFLGFYLDFGNTYAWSITEWQFMLVFLYPL